MFAPRSDLRLLIQERDQATRGPKKGDELGFGPDSIGVDIEQDRVSREKSLDLYWELKPLSTLLEVSQGDDAAGLVEDLADDARDEVVALVGLDGGVEERVLPPCDLEARDRGGLDEGEEGGFRVSREARNGFC